MLEVEVFAKLALLLDILYQSEVVRTDIHLKLRGLCSCRVESGLELGVKMLQVTRAFLVEGTDEVGVLGEVVL